MGLDELKEKSKLELYTIKKFIHFLFSSPQTLAKNTDPKLELREVLGVPLGSIFDFEIGQDLLYSGGLKARTYNLYYNPKINQIISLALSGDYVLINFYAGLKLKSNLEYIEAFQIYSHFSKSLNVDNDTLPVIRTENAFYSFLKVYSEEFILYPDQEKYLEKFFSLCKDSSLLFDNLVYSFSDEFKLEPLDADNYKILIRPRNYLDRGRKFKLRKKENLVDEVTDILSPLGFEPTHYLNINGNFILGKSRINGRTLKTGVYVTPDSRKKGVFEVKVLSTIKFTISANEDELQISKKYDLGGFNAIQNTANLHKVKKSNIDKDYLKQILTEIKGFIESRTRNLANVEVFRETVPNEKTKFRFSFQVVIRELKNYDDGKFYAVNYLQAVKNIQTIIDLAISKFTAKNLITKEDIEGLVDDEILLDPLLKVKKFEYYAGAFSTPKVKEVF